MKHELKIKPEYLAAINFGEKTFEIRNNADRNFQVGDTLRLKAWDGEFTGDFVEKVVSYITDFEQKPGYVVLGLVNHHEHEMDLAAQLSDVTRQCGVMAGLLLEANDSVYFHLESPDSILSGEEAGKLIALTEHVADALAGKLPTQHPDDAAVDRFAVAMKAKLAAARAKGRGGWDDPDACSVEFLAELLVDHIGKGNTGNFEDIGNLAMMLHQRGADPAVLAGKLPAPVIGEKRTVTISGKGLLELVDFICPDHETDIEQQETEIVLLNREAFTSTDGEEMPSGVYAYLAEYPEEGLYGPIGGAA